MSGQLLKLSFVHKERSELWTVQLVNKQTDVTTIELVVTTVESVRDSKSERNDNVNNADLRHWTFALS
jgi:hypothetical protein